MSTDTSAEARALEVMSGDWDEDGTCSPSIPRELASVILEKRGRYQEAEKLLREALAVRRAASFAAVVGR